MRCCVCVTRYRRRFITMGMFHEMLHVCEQVQETFHNNGNVS